MPPTTDEIDLAKPGKLWAQPLNERTTTFHLVIPKGEYTRDQLSRSPNINPADNLMAPFTVHQGQLRDGVAICDLAPRANEIMQKLNERYDRGEPPIQKVRGVVICTARDGNRIPDAQLAEVHEFKLKPLPSIRLKGLVTSVSVNQYKQGVRLFQLELQTTGLAEVAISCTPALQINAGRGGHGHVVCPTQDGAKNRFSLPVPFSSHVETRQRHVNVPYIHYGHHRGWRGAWATDHSETWTGGQVTVRVTGTGQHAGLAQSVTCEAVSWASGWLNVYMPGPFYHNSC